MDSVVVVSDAVVTYLESNNITLTSFGYNVIIYLLKTNNNVGILIISVTKGSILIDFTISSNDAQKILPARAAILNSTGESYSIGNFTLNVQNIEYISPNTSDSTNIFTFTTFIVYITIILYIIYSL